MSDALNISAEEAETVKEWHTTDASSDGHGGCTSGRVN
jgi:hypothetical protein